MVSNRKLIPSILRTLFVAGLALSSCRPQQTTAVATEGMSTTPGVIDVIIPKEVLQSDTLIICMGQEPSSLYLYGGRTTVARNIQEAIYDGPYDYRSFTYQPVILEKLPHLDDGDAFLETVTVSEGDLVVDEENIPLVLEPGVSIRPSGCLTSNCFEEYMGGSIEMDQMVVTFTLLPGLNWSDGTPLKASDSVYSFTIASNPGTPTSKFITNRTATYLALNDQSLVWKGRPGFLDSTYYLNFFDPLPEHVLGQYSPLELLQVDVSTRYPIGWGPYVIEQWIPGDSITMRKNPHYFRAIEGLPHFDKLVYRFIGTNPNENIAALLTGECDVLDQTTLLDDYFEVLVELQTADQLEAIFMPSNFFEHIDLGLHPVSYDDGYSMAAGDRPDFFGDVRIRQAIAMCLDRQTVVDSIFYGRTNVLRSYLHEKHLLFNHTAIQYDYDPEAGKALLGEVGWVDEDGDGIREAHNIPGIRDSTPLSIRYWTTLEPQREQVSKIFEQNLSDCGIEISLLFFSFDEFFNYSMDGPVAGRDFDLVQFAYGTAVEPICEKWLSDKIPGDTGLIVADVPWMFEVLGNSSSPQRQAFIEWDIWNHSGYANPEFDAVCERALKSLPTEEAYRRKVRIWFAL
jgi:peptide/nickel transport system substrate-binding protein